MIRLLNLGSSKSPKLPPHWPSPLHNKCNIRSCTHPNPPQVAEGVYQCQGSVKGSQCTGTYYVGFDQAASTMLEHKKWLEAKSLPPKTLKRKTAQRQLSEKGSSSVVCSSSVACSSRPPTPPPKPKARAADRLQSNVTPFLHRPLHRPTLSNSSSTSASSTGSHGPASRSTPALVSSRPANLRSHPIALIPSASHSATALPLSSPPKKKHSRPKVPLPSDAISKISKPRPLTPYPGSLSPPITSSTPAAAVPEVRYRLDVDLPQGRK